MNLTGTIHKVFDTQVISERFKKREFVIKVEQGNYDQYISMEFQRDNVGQLDKVKEGMRVSVDFQINGREWISPKGDVKYFNTLVAFNIEIFSSDDLPY